MTFKLAYWPLCAGGDARPTLEDGTTRAKGVAIHYMPQLKEIADILEQSHPIAVYIQVNEKSFQFEKGDFLYIPKPDHLEIRAISTRELSLLSFDLSQLLVPKEFSLPFDLAQVVEI